jgi:hypothetical protein
VSAIRARWTGILVASAALAGAVAATGGPSLLRVAVVLWFVLVCPGMAFVRLLDLDDAAAEIALAVALSITLAMTVGGVALYAGLWAPGASLAILVAITIAAALAPAARARTGAPGARARASLSRPRRRP